MTRIGILAENLYEEMELWYPYFRMKEEGFQVQIIGSGTSTSFKGKNGYPVQPDIDIQHVHPLDYDVIIIPGGFSPDYMRRVPKMVELVNQCGTHGKIIAAICHGVWMLISAELIKGKRVTSYFSIKDDVKNAGATWVDEPVVIDDNILTSRVPSDLPVFCRAILEKLRSTIGV